MLALSGFTDVVMSSEIDVFSGSRHESDAKQFETRGVTIFARRPSATDDSGQQGRLRGA